MEKGAGATRNYMSASSRSNLEAVRQLFAKDADEYSRHYLSERRGANFCFRRRLDLTLELAQPISGRLLDCAAGTGEITSALLQTGRFDAGTVVDLSPQMLDRTRERLANATCARLELSLSYVQSDIFKFQLVKHDEPFDLILCLGLIAHTGRLPELLENLRGMLAPGGRILLQSSLMDHLGTRMVRALAAERYFRNHGYRLSFYANADILAAVQIAGLQVEAVRRFSFGLPFGDRIWPWANYQVERLFQGWSAVHGSDALYLLRGD
jgi:ubiquinone/menaquinone biosynthesis C-methylase UbiE